MRSTTQSLSDNTAISLELKNLNVYKQGGTLIEKIPLEHSSINSIFNNNSIFKINNYLAGNIKTSYNTSNNSKIIELLEKETKSRRSRSEIFSRASTGTPLSEGVTIYQPTINSPLEQSEITSTIQSQVAELLSYNLTLHFIMIYLIMMAIFILTIKILTDKKFSFEKIKNIPFGKYIYIVIEKLISIWSKSNTLWIYFILFSLLIMMASATYGIYGCLYLINYLLNNKF